MEKKGPPRKLPGIAVAMSFGLVLGGAGLSYVLHDNLQEKWDLHSDRGPEAARQAGLVKAAREAVARGTPLRVYLGSLDGPFVNASCAPASKFFNRETTCAFSIGADQATPEIEFALEQPRESFIGFPPVLLLADGTVDPDCKATPSGWTCTAKIDRDDLRNAKYAELAAATPLNQPIQGR